MSNVKLSLDAFFLAKKAQVCASPILSKYMHPPPPFRIFLYVLSLDAISPAAPRFRVEDNVTSNPH
jgi:hypothetical protein